jgi:hypothetical protein
MVIGLIVFFRREALIIQVITLLMLPSMADYHFWLYQIGSSVLWEIASERNRLRILMISHFIVQMHRQYWLGLSPFLKLIIIQTKLRILYLDNVLIVV